MKKEAFGVGKTVNRVAPAQLVRKDHLHVSLVVMVQLIISLVVSVKMVWSGNGLVQAMGPASLAYPAHTKLGK